MTVLDWLRQRSPAPPRRLTDRIGEVLGRRGHADSRDAPEHCIAAAAQLLLDLAERSSVGRESALDLLTVDALVTYAFESAAAQPATIPMRADAAMAQLAAAGG